MIYFLIMIREFCITHVAPAGTSFVTIHPAPIFALDPIFIGPIILAPAPMKTLSSIIGAPQVLLPSLLVNLFSKLLPNSNVMKNRTIISNDSLYRKKASINIVRKKSRFWNNTTQWNICTLCLQEFCVVIIKYRKPS